MAETVLPETRAILCRGGRMSIRFFILFLFSLFLIIMPVSVSAVSPGVEFRISTSYQNLLSNSDGTGFLDRLFAEVFRRLEMQAVFVYTPTDKSLVDVNAGVLDAEISRIEGMEETYPDLVRVPEPNMTMRFVAFVKEGKPGETAAKETVAINGWESIRGLYIGMVRGWKILEWNTTGFPHVTQTRTEQELFGMLDHGRLDIALYSLLTGYAVVKESGYEGITALFPPLETREMYMYLHKSKAYLAEPVAETIRAVKRDGTWQAIFDDVVRKNIPEAESYGK